LPETSGTGVPDFVDWVAATLPNPPDCPNQTTCPAPGAQIWSQGLDPHTVTAYVSPNIGRAYALMANGGNHARPTWVAAVDMQALLAAPRSPAHTVDPNYDLIANKVVRYIATGN